MHKIHKIYINMHKKWYNCKNIKNILHNYQCGCIMSKVYSIIIGNVL